MLVSCQDVFKLHCLDIIVIANMLSAMQCKIIKMHSSGIQETMPYLFNDVEVHLWFTDKLPSVSYILCQTFCTDVQTVIDCTDVQSMT